MSMFVVQFYLTYSRPVCFRVSLSLLQIMRESVRVLSTFALDFVLCKDHLYEPAACWPVFVQWSVNVWIPNIWF